MRKLILPDRFKKKGRLAYYTLAHKTGAMVLVGFYLDKFVLRQLFRSMPLCAI